MNKVIRHKISKLGSERDKQLRRFLMLYKMDPSIDECSILLYSKDEIFKANKHMVTTDKVLQGVLEWDRADIFMVEGAALEIFDKYVIAARDFSRPIEMVQGDTLAVTWDV